MPIMFHADLTDEERQLLTTPMADATLPGLHARTDLAAADINAAAQGITTSHLLAIETFHQSLAVRLENAFSSMLRRPVAVQLTSASTGYFSQFAMSRAIPTCLVTLQAPQLSQPLAIEISPTVLFPMLDVLLGGGRRACEIPHRPPTEIEQKLAHFIANTLIDELHEAWEPVLAVSLSVDRVDSHAQRVRLVAPNENVVTLVFRFSIADHAGDVSLCLPIPAIHKMIEKLVTDHSIAARREKGTPSDFTRLEVILGTIELTADQIGRIKSGDILFTELPADRLATIVVNGQPRFEARMGSVNGVKAVVVQ
jgi:flagellar motor switch protein FliM